jgi:hypothetical protein
MIEEDMAHLAPEVQATIRYIQQLGWTAFSRHRMVPLTKE